MSQTLIYIVEHDLFVSEDMKDVLQSVLPSADCRCVDSISEAHQASGERGDPWAVLVTANADGSFDIPTLALEWLSAQNVIAFDVDDTGRYPGWEHLQKPFSDMQLTEAVRRLLAVRPLRAAE